jgi:glutathione synthase
LLERTIFSVRFLFITDSLSRLKPQKDSTVALMRAAARAGDEIYACELADWSLHDCGVQVSAQKLRVVEEHASWYTVEESGDYAADFFNLVLMRKEPPADAAFMMNTLLLDAAIAMGTPVVNAPRALREYNEKLSIFRFPHHIAPTMVSADAKALADFHAAHDGAVIKPLDGMGGRGVYVSPPQDKNFPAIVDLLSSDGRDLIMAQTYLPAAREGDNRVFVIGGKPAPWMLARLPRENDHRGNMAAGGLAEARPLSVAARRIAEDIAPTLLAAGIIFAGLDVLGEHLTEINITCPTGLREVRDQTGDDLAEDVLDTVRAVLVPA